MMGVLLEGVRYLKSVPSANGRAMNSIPTGSPSVVNPAGTVMAGKPRIGLNRRLLPIPDVSSEALVMSPAPISTGW